MERRPKKPVAIVACEDAEEGERIVNSLNNKDSTEPRIDWKVKLSQDRTNIGKGGQAYIATDPDRDSSQYKLARKMKKKAVPCARVLVTSKEKLIDQYRTHTSWLRRVLTGRKVKKAPLLKRYFVDRGGERSPEKIDWGDFKNWFRNTSSFHDIVIEDDKHPLDSEMGDAIEYARQGRKICQPLSIGVIGLGKLGRQAIHDLKAKPHIENVHAFSEFAKGNYEKLIIPRIAFGKDERKNFHFHDALEELVEANPDLIIVSTGEYGVPYEKYRRINTLTERLMKGSYPKVKKVLELLEEKKYNGCIFMESNPVGPLLQVAKRIGIDPSMLTSISPDLSRHKTLLLEILSGAKPWEYEEIMKEIMPEMSATMAKEVKRKSQRIEYGERKKDLQYSDINLRVIGEHGKEIPLLREAKVRCKPLVEVFPEFNEYEYRRAFTNEGRHIGLNLMQVAEDLGDNYGGTPDEIVEQIENFAFLGGTIPSAYSYFAGADCFIGAPSIIEYPLRIKSVSDLDDLSQDEEAMSELRKHIEYQIALADEYHPAA